LTPTTAHLTWVETFQEPLLPVWTVPGSGTGQCTVGRGADVIIERRVVTSAILCYPASTGNRLNLPCQMDGLYGRSDPCMGITKRGPKTSTSYIPVSN